MTLKKSVLNEEIVMALTGPLHRPDGMPGPVISPPQSLASPFKGRKPAIVKKYATRLAERKAQGKDEDQAVDEADDEADEKEPGATEGDQPVPDAGPSHVQPVAGRYRVVRRKT